MKRIFFYLFFVSLAVNHFSLQAQDAVATVAKPDYWYPVVVKGKMGYIDNAGNLRINAELERVETYLLENVKGPFIKATIDGKTGVFDRAAKSIVPVQYSSIYIDEDSKLIRVSKEDPSSMFSIGGLNGFVDYEGKEVIPVRYKTQLFNGGYSFQEGLWCYEENDKQGYMDKSGVVQIKPSFYAASDFKNGLAAAQPVEKGGYGYIDKKGSFKISPQFYSAGDFNANGFAVVKIKETDPTLSIINSKGKFIAKNLPYRLIGGVMSTPEFYNGLITALDTVKNKYGFIDESGKLAIPLQYDYAENFEKDGLAIVNVGSVTEGKGWMATHTGGKWGFIDVKGNMVIPYFRAEQVGIFAEGMAAVKINGLWGFIDSKGEIAIEPQWKERPGFFEGGFARVYEKSAVKGDKSYVTYMKIGYIDKSGKYLWEIQE